MKSEANAVPGEKPVAKCSRDITKLKHYLTQHGTIMHWVALRTRIDYNRLFRLCAGQGEPTLNEGLRIRRALECEFEEIFDIDDTLAEVEDGHD
ncbi:MAG: hypothetical protein M1469_01515 [Bacteroidetes bacterium]|nr:hypothetical protein [Bacteroidota bacterium]